MTVRRAAGSRLCVRHQQDIRRRTTGENCPMNTEADRDAGALGQAKIRVMRNKLCSKRNPHS